MSLTEHVCSKVKLLRVKIYSALKNLCCFVSEIHILLLDAIGSLRIVGVFFHNYHITSSVYVQSHLRFCADFGYGQADSV